MKILLQIKGKKVSGKIIDESQPKKIELTIQTKDIVMASFERFVKNDMSKHPHCNANYYEFLKRYLLRCLNESYPKIAKSEEKHHATIINSMKEVNNATEKEQRNPELYKMYNRLQNHLIVECDFNLNDHKHKTIQNHKNDN